MHYLVQHSAERLAKGNAKFFNLAVGDKVLLKDNFCSSKIFAKADWTPVKVTEIFPSSDGAVRTVTVQKENGNEQTLTTDKLAIVEEDLLERYRKCQGLQTVDRHDDGSDENDEERIPTTAGREGLQASLQCDNEEDATTAGHNGLPTTSENDKENQSTAGREGLRASLQCDMSCDRASSAHTTPSTSNARASTEETASAGRHRGRPRGAKNRSWQGDPTRYAFRSSTTIDDDVQVKICC
jgi:hypothetical protein